MVSQQTELSSKYSLAKAWLLAELSDGLPHVAGGLLLRAAAAGHAELTVRHAANALHVRQFSACMAPGRKSALTWLWQL